MSEENDLKKQIIRLVFRYLIILALTGIVSFLGVSGFLMLTMPEGVDVEFDDMHGFDIVMTFCVSLVFVVFPLIAVGFILQLPRLLRTVKSVSEEVSSA